MKLETEMEAMSAKQNRVVFVTGEEENFFLLNRVHAAQMQIEEMANSLKAAAVILRKMGDEISGFHDLVEVNLGRGYEEWRRTFANNLVDFAEAQKKMYGSYRRIIDFFPSSDTAFCNGVRQKCAESFGVETDLIDGRLIVKTPLLASGQNAKRFGDTYRYSANQIPLMSEEIRDKVSELADVERMAFLQKEVMVLSVYPCGEIEIPDADNMLVKAQSDAITSQLPGGDSAENCAFYFRNIRRSDVSPGTYFIVSKGCDHALTAETAIETLKKHRPKNSSF